MLSTLVLAVFMFVLDWRCLLYTSTCSQYSNIPCGTLCGTQHRIRAEAVLTLITDMLRAIAEYSRCV